MHGQALPSSVYENGPNDYEVAFLMITSKHWDCCTVYIRPTAMSLKETYLPIPVSYDILVQLGSWLSILISIMVHAIRLK